ncbi:MAG TPA: hypothetical protein VGM70_01350 [Pseudolysinimonas sp.]|jgi:hypothetical protein
MRPRFVIALAALGVLAAALGAVAVAAPAQADPLAGSQTVVTNVQEVFSVSAPDRFVHTEFDATLPAGGSGTVRISARVRAGCADPEKTVTDTVTITADGHYSDDLAVPYNGYAIVDVDASDGAGSSAPQSHTELGISAMDAAAMTQGDFVVSFTPDSPANSGTVGFNLGEVGPAGGDFDIAVDGTLTTTGLQIPDCGLQYLPWSAVADGSTIAVSNHSTHQVLASFTVPGGATGSTGGQASGSGGGAAADPALAETGVDIAPLALGATGLVTAGVMVVGLTMLGRRRRLA